MGTNLSVLFDLKTVFSNNRECVSGLSTLDEVGTEQLITVGKVYFWPALKYLNPARRL